MSDLLKNPLLFLVLVFATAVPFKTPAQFRFDSLTTQNGLPQNSVYSISQTPDGYIWFATLDGLVRFDGVRFSVFNKTYAPQIPGNRFTVTHVDREGTLWAGTEASGLVRYKDGDFKSFTNADGLNSDRIHQIKSDTDGGLLILGNNGWIKQRDGIFESEPERDFRNSQLYIGASGTRWEIDRNGLTMTRDGVKTVYSLPFDPDRIQSDRTFNYLVYVPVFEDRRGRFWFAGNDRLFSLFDGRIDTFDKQHGLPASRIRDMTEDREGNIWIATDSAGVCRLNNRQISCFGKENGLRTDSVLSLFVDREGTVWAGTNGGGVVRVSLKSVMSVSRTEGLANSNVYPILETAPGEVWLGTTTTLSQYKDGRIVNYTPRDGLFYEIVQSLHKDRTGRLWVGSVGGVQYFQNGRFYDFLGQLGLKTGDRDFFCIHEDRNGVLWFATRLGVISYENGVTKTYGEVDGMPGAEIRYIYEARDGSLWFAALGGVGHLKDGQITAITTKDGLGGNNIRSIFEDEDGTMWFGSYDAGLSRLKNGKITNYSSRDGLHSDGAFRILPDDHGNFWISSNQGIYRVSRRELDDFAEGRISRITSTVFGVSDGMLNIECNGGRSPAGIKASDGRLWFPTQDGAAVIDPDNISINPREPPVLIERVTVDGQPKKLTPGVENQIEIEPGQRNIEIEYTGLSFIKPDQVRFKYRLEELNSDWTDASSRRAAFYPYLPPGRYVFHVIAANSDGVWNEKGASVVVVVSPFFFQTWWFLTACIAGLLILTFLVYRYQINLARARQAAQEDFSRRLLHAHETERRRVAAELHDSIGQSLAMIKNTSVFGAESMTDLADAREHLSEITTQTAQAITEVREIAYNLRPFMLDRLGLTKSIGALVNKIADNSNIDFFTALDDIDRIFDADTEISIYRMVQESLNNILKHSEAKRVDITVKNEHDVVVVEISDNGRGFDLRAVGKRKQEGFGLLGMSERVRMIGGTMSIDSVPGHGTAIKINLWKKNSES